MDHRDDCHVRSMVPHVARNSRGGHVSEICRGIHGVGVGLRQVKWIARDMKDGDETNLAIASGGGGGDDPICRCGRGVIHDDHFLHSRHANSVGCGLIDDCTQHCEGCHGNCHGGSLGDCLSLGAVILRGPGLKWGYSRCRGRCGIRERRGWWWERRQIASFCYLRQQLSSAHT